ncbi:16726_t:CDS:2, partial [Entrophospora sp. SA101]
DDAIASDIPSRDLSQYFIREKSMDQAGKIDTMCLEVDTEIIPEVSDEIDISKTNNNTLQEIPNMTPYLAQLENYSGDSVKTHTPSLLESHPQISIGGVGTIPIVADAVASSLRESTLMSQLSAYICLILLIIAVMWFVVLRRTWGLGRKSERLRDMWIVG